MLMSAEHCQESVVMGVVTIHRVGIDVIVILAIKLPVMERHALVSHVISYFFLVS